MKPAPGGRVGPEGLSTREAWLEPFGWYREMREESPVRYDPDRGVWDVFRYDDVEALLEDDALSADPTNAADYEASELGGQTSIISKTMVQQDPPRHDELRDVVDDAFKPGALREFEPRIRELATNLLADVLADDPEVVDVVRDVATPLPVLVIAELLGVPEAKREAFRRWSDAFVTVPGDTADEAAFGERRTEMVTYFTELVADRRRDPRDDLVSRIATAEFDDGSRLSPREAFSMCALLLVAGNVTVRNLLGNAVWCLADLGLRAELTGDDLSAAIEEVLRYRSPIQTTGRVAVEDVTVRGASIEAGERVTMWLGSANRDPRQFDAPETFDPDRTPNRHLAFGHGVHYCLGAPLARLQAEVVLSELLDRWDGLELAETRLPPVRNPTVHGVESLPVRFETAT